MGVSRHSKLYRARVALIGTKHDRVRVLLQGVRSSHRMGPRHRLGRLYRVWYTGRPLPTERPYFRSRLFPPRCPLLRSTEDLQEHPPQRRMGPSRTKFRFQERSQQGPISFSLLSPILKSLLLAHYPQSHLHTFRPSGISWCGNPCTSYFRLHYAAHFHKVG